ncbi:MAG: FRG domain-containing protein [Dehalogenimonas sp.]
MKKPDYYETIECTSLADFISKLEHIPESPSEAWIYRGQELAKWPLETSFDRACARFKVPYNQRTELFGLMLREFKRKAHQYRDNLPLDECNDEWMSIMQHHGAPTRILDFTYSPYIAMFFAFENSECNSKIAVWALNATWNDSNLINYSSVIGDAFAEYQHNRHWHQFSEVLKRKNVPRTFVLNFNPFKLHERLSHQRGVFLYQGNLNHKLGYNIKVFRNKVKPTSSVIKKFELKIDDKGKVRDEALKYLEKMNITRYTLFPDLEGFLMSFSSRIPTYFMRYQIGHGLECPDC